MKNDRKKTKLPIMVLVTLLPVAVLLAACQTITICKVTQPPGGAGFPFTAARGSQAAPLPSFTLNDTQCNTTTLITGQDHLNTYTENVPVGWILTNISCSATTTSAVRIIGANANPAFQLGDNTVAIDLSEPNVTCKFENRPTPPCCLFSLDLSTGQGNTAVDPLWTVNGGTAFTTPPVSAWTATVPAAGWIQPPASPTPAPNVPASPPIYDYSVSFNVSACSMGHAEVSGRFAADNNAAVFVDNNLITGATCANCFATASVPFSSPPLLPGSHVLEIRVTNLTNSYSGLVANAHVTRICP
jgi:hypothetical protein